MAQDMGRHRVNPQFGGAIQLLPTQSNFSFTEFGLVRLIKANASCIQRNSACPVRSKNAEHHPQAIANSIKPKVGDHLQMLDTRRLAVMRACCLANALEMGT